MRFDIGWRDLAKALWFCASPANRGTATEDAEVAWSAHGNCLATLSVRSAFDLLLQELNLRKGDEILMSAWTVPGMVQIVRAHGLVPVPVDVDQRGHLIQGSLKRSISPNSRMLVVAHLFGGRAPLDEHVPLLKRNNMLLVEDCAQSFDHVGEPGHPASDVVMHSFGPIKTSTALGGGIIEVRSHQLCHALRKRMNEYPTQSRSKFAKRVFRFAALKLLSGRMSASLLYGCLNRLGVNVDAMANSLGKGFSDADFLRQIRHQPSTPLLRLMKLRFATFNGESIRYRMKLGRVFDRAADRVSIDPESSRWICPVFLENPSLVCDMLRGLGFDATARSRMVVVPPADEKRVAFEATRNWKKIAFLPWYSDLSQREVRRLAELVRPYLGDEHSFEEFSNQVDPELLQPTKPASLAGEAVL